MSAPHIILSSTLLILTLWLGWSGIIKERRRHAWISGFAGAALCSFHPYFLPLILLFSGLCVLTRLIRKDGWNVKSLVPLALPVLVTLVVYLPMLQDADFVRHHAKDNRLPLAPLHTWILMSPPFLVAIWYRFKKRIRIQAREEWLLIWIGAATLFALLPIPFKAKGIEALGIAPVFLTMPAWGAAVDWIKKSGLRIMRKPLLILLAVGGGLGPLQLLISQFAWASDPSRNQWFYQPESVFQMWAEIRPDKGGKCLTISDNRWIAIWTPANTLCRTWIAHDHETPDFKNKLIEWKNMMQNRNLAQVEKYLEKTMVTHVITTEATTSTGFGLLDKSRAWKQKVNFGQVTLWVKN